MRDEDIGVPVDELIRRYNEELLAMKKRHDATKEEVIPTIAELDTLYPPPNVEEDLAALRKDADAVEVTDNEAENNAVNEESRGQTGAPPAPPPLGIPAFPLYPTEEELLPPSTPPPREMSLGYLKTAVTTGRGVLPVPNAQVIVTRVVNEEEILEQAARTDISGYTPLFTLPAVSGIYSQSPANADPFTYYTIYVRADGFYPVRLRNVPLYGGVTAIQPVDLIPVAEGDTSDRERVIVEGAPEISNSSEVRT